MRFKQLGMAALFLVAFGMTCPWAQAGNEMGNGGDVFYYPGPGPGAPRAELVDIFEARRAGRKLDFGPANLDHMGKVRYILNKWSKISPLRMAKYSAWLDTFWSEAKIEPRATLPNVPDEGILVIPEGSRPEQVAIQLADEDLGTHYKRYTISQTFWDLMDEDNRAALVLHELVFREAILAKNRVSPRVRYLNSILFSESTVQEYFDASKNLDGLFLEWGWAGFENLDMANSLKGVVLSDFEASGWKVSNLDSYWIDTGTVKGKATQCNIVEKISRDSWGNRTRCSQFSGKAEFSPQDHIDLMGLRIEGLRSSLVVEMDGRPTQPAVQIPSIDAQRIVWTETSWRKYEDKNLATLTLTCTGVSQILAVEWYRKIHLTSQSGDGECRLDFTRLDTPGVKTKTRILRKFHKLQMSFGIEDDYGDPKLYLKITDFDGEEQREFRFGSRNLTCTNSALASDVYSCDSRGLELACFVPLLNAQGFPLRNQFAQEKINFLDTFQLKVRTEKSYQEYDVLLPAGQMVAYRKVRWNEYPEKLKEPRWVGLDLSKSGECTLSKFQ